MQRRPLTTRPAALLEAAAVPAPILDGAALADGGERA